MNVFGNTCPMCCGDLDDVAYLRAGVAVCLSCGCTVEAPASEGSTARGPFSVNGATAMGGPRMAQAPAGLISRSYGTQIQTGASMARTESTTH